MKPNEQFISHSNPLHLRLLSHITFGVSHCINTTADSNRQSALNHCRDFGCTPACLRTNTKASFQSEVEWFHHAWTTRAETWTEIFLLQSSHMSSVQRAFWMTYSTDHKEEGQGSRIMKTGVEYNHIRFQNVSWGNKSGDGKLPTTTKVATPGGGVEFDLRMFNALNHCQHKQGPRCTKIAG